MNEYDSELLLSLVNSCEKPEDVMALAREYGLELTYDEAAAVLAGI